MGTMNYSGNKLTGVPNAQWNVGLDASSTSGFSLTTSFGKVGRIPMNDQNSKYTETYSLLDIKASYTYAFKSSKNRTKYGNQ
jgi:iron complex outermembrane receptor protein